MQIDRPGRVTRRQLVAGAVGLGFAPPAAAAAFCQPVAYGINDCEVGLAVPSDLQTVPQRRRNWCWAASAQAIFAFHGFQIAQETIVATMYGDLYDQPAPPAVLFATFNREWETEDGEAFSAHARLLFDAGYGFRDPSSAQIVIDELANDRPLINGALGHATVMTAMRFRQTPQGVLPLAITVRDPWPYNPNRRTLSLSEYQNPGFLAAIAVE